MWPAALSRLLRRRLPYILITIFAFILILHKLYGQHGALQALQDDNEVIIQRTSPLIWRTLEEHVLPDDANNRTNDATLHCRNTLQGRDLLADERGFVCTREHLLANGCCNVEWAETLYYTCATCNTTTHCCGVYEYCVSCCLHPSKRALLELVLSSVVGRQAAVYALVEDQFDLCLVKCRTNSHSVEHENKYRDAAAKYCYGPTQPHESQLEVAGQH